MKRILALALLLCLFLTACTADKDVSKNTDDSDSIIIGCIVQANAKHKKIGIETKNGIELALNEINDSGGINGKILKAEYFDCASIDDAVNSFDSLIKNKSSAVICSGNSDFLFNISVKSEYSQIPVFLTSGIDSQINNIQKKDNIFMLGFSNWDQTKSAAKFAKRILGIDSAAVIYNENDSYSAELAASFKKAFDEYGGKNLIECTYKNGDSDFEQILKDVSIKRPGLIYTPDYFETSSKILQQAKALEINSIFMGSDLWDVPIIDEDLTNYYYPIHYPFNEESNIITDFRTSYENSFNKLPTSFAALSYDAVFVLKDALIEKEANEKLTLIDIIKQINSEYITGNISFDKNGNIIKKVYISRMDSSGTPIVENFN